jgi:hypothetical protein
MSKSHRSTRCSLTLLLLLGVAALGASEERALDESDVKAGYLFNFANFVEWPSKALPDEPSAFVACVLGDDAFAVLLERTLDGKAIGKHPFVVKRLSRDQDWGACHMLVVGNSLGNHLSDVAAKVAGTSVLTVSDIEHFSELGGMIGITRDGGRLHLAISRVNAERAGLKISAKLLSLATLTDSPATGQGKP